jgi:hypothetical protein
MRRASAFSGKFGNCTSLHRLKQELEGAGVSAVAASERLRGGHTCPSDGRERMREWPANWSLGPLDDT